MQIQFARLRRHRAPAQFVGEGAGAGAVYRLAVRFQPLADGFEAFDAFARDDALGRRADVEQIIAALGHDIDQQAEQLFDGFPVQIVFLEAPGVVEGGRRFPIAIDAPRGNLVVAHRGIIAQVVAGAPVHQAIGLAFVHLLHEGAALGQSDVDRRIVPDQADRAVLRQQLLDLRQSLFLHVAVEVLLGGIVVPIVARGVGVMPILFLRIIKTETDSGLFAGRGEFGHWIAAEGRGVDDVIGAGLRMVHREAVMVLGGDDQIFHPRVFGHGHPFLGVELRGIESPGEFFVFGDGDFGALHDPLANAGNLLVFPDARGNGVEAPVDEHPEPGFAPPLHSFGFALAPGRRFALRSHRPYLLARLD
ncbi:MAG: hypothetical protein BWZ10_02779 [candidate division BRC1 bacterium ADurb.BinA364]|nr:MAG: hypothetical protein BWZ10_02779 [candidate division BRC1 bacterium ADurb.BinA364]